MNILWIALVLGLSSSFHCLAMCVPLAMAIPLRSKKGFNKFLAVLEYHLGRVLVYGLLGALVAQIGMAFEIFDLMQWLTVAIGMVFILWVLYKYFGLFQLKKGLRKSKMGGAMIFISKLYGKARNKQFRMKGFILGGINGMLPCGMVYIALTLSITAESTVVGMGTMMMFGIGTLPALVALNFFRNAKLWESLKMKKMLPYMMLLLACLVTVRGMNLGVPYLSPKVEIIASRGDNCSSDKAEMSCCSAKELEPMN